MSLPVRSLRVTLVITQLGTGGTEKQLVLLARGLLERQIDVDVVALYAGGPRLAELAEAGVPVLVLGMTRPPRRPLSAAIGVARLLRHLRRRRPHVVHAFLIDAYVLAAPLAKMAGVDAVVAGRRALSEYKAGRGAVHRLEAASTRCVDLVVANSRAVAADVVATERLDPAMVVVIPNALPSPPRTRRPRAFDHPPVVLCVANLWSYKGHADLLAATALLHRRGVAMRLLLVGEGPDRAALERAVAADHLPVELLGARDDVERLLRDSDVFVLASHMEGMSNALMEAVAAGLPVVATDVGGNAEVVGRAGVLCPPHRPDALAAALERVLLDEGLRRTLVTAGAERVREWTVEAMVDRHLEEYGKVLTRRCVA